MSFPLMFRSKVGEMKFSIPQSLLAERGKGAHRIPSHADPQQHRTGQRHQAALGCCDTPGDLTGSNSLLPAPATRQGAGLDNAHFGAEWPFSWGFTGGNSQPSVAGRSQSPLTIQRTEVLSFHTPCFGDKIMTFQHVQFPAPKPWAMCAAREFTQPKH